MVADVSCKDTVAYAFCKILQAQLPFIRLYIAALEGELRLVHPRLSAPVAEALGVASRRRLMLAASADCLALGLAGAGGAVEAFGQSEALTTRLRHIIQVGWLSLRHDAGKSIVVAA
jgi:hypothetical protein